MSLQIDNSPIITVKDINHSCIILDVSKSDAIQLLINSVLGNHGYI